MVATPFRVSPNRLKMGDFETDSARKTQLPYWITRRDPERTTSFELSRRSKVDVTDTEVNQRDDHGSDKESRKYDGNSPDNSHNPEEFLEISALSRCPITFRDLSQRTHEK